MTTPDLDQPAGLADLIDYQDEAVVSRILLKKATGSVTLFAFDKGQELSEHTVAHDALVQVLDGAVEISVDGQPRNAQSGQVLLMPGGHPHAVRAVERFKMLLTMIRE